MGGTATTFLAIYPPSSMLVREVKLTFTFLVRSKSVFGNVKSEFPHPLERRRPRHSHPEASQGGVCEVAAVAKSPSVASCLRWVAVNRPLHVLTARSLSVTGIWRQQSAGRAPLLLQNGNGFNLDQEIFAGQSGYPDPSAGRQSLCREEPSKASRTDRALWMWSPTMYKHK